MTDPTHSELPSDGWTVVDEPAPQPPPFNVRIHHGGINVPDLEASIRWYRENLGFAVEIRTLMPQVPFTGAFLRRGSVRIELFHREGAKPLPDERRDPASDLATHGVKHFALEVDDIEGALSFLSGRGVEIAMPLMSNGAISAAYIRDNSGMLIELIEHHDSRRQIGIA